MNARKDRIRVVLDTNVFVRNFKNRSKAGPNCKVIRLWLVEKRFQLVVSREIVAEYLEIFEEILAMDREPGSHLFEMREMRQLRWRNTLRTW